MELIQFTVEENLSLGVHYCAVENKQTAQVYQQNAGWNLPKTAYFSPRDYFIKTAKVFGEDIKPVRQLFMAMEDNNYFYENIEHNFLEFHVNKIPLITSLNVEVGVSINILESRDGDPYLRELKVNVTSPQKFNLEDMSPLKKHRFKQN